MNLKQWNLAKRYRATERITMGNFNHVVQLKNVITTIIKCQNIHNAQLANLNARIAVLEAMFPNLDTATNPNTVFVLRKRPEA